MERQNPTAANLLKALREGPGPLSGELMARKLGVSRAAVWKAVDSLRSEGYRIEGAKGEGYRLEGESHRLSASGIKSLLDPFWEAMEVEVHDRLDSTNRRAKEGDRKPRLILAREQTAGRGRRGRDFFSPKGSGLYLSLAFPWQGEGNPQLLTTLAAVASARVLDRFFSTRIGIKWVNDLYWKKRKVGGILTEAVTDLESASETLIVLGVGLNLFPPEGGFPPELVHRAGALADRPIPLNWSLLAACLVNEVGRLIMDLPSRAYLDDYRSRCFHLGQEVVLSDGERVLAQAISDEGGLVVRQGNREWELFSGEVSLVAEP